MTAAAVIAAADGADRPAHGAAHGNLLFDSRFNIGNQAVVVLTPANVGPGLDVADALLLNHLGLENPGDLIFRAPAVVHNSGFPPEQPCQFRQGCGVKALKIPVQLIVAQPEGEHIHLLRLQLRFCQRIDGRQLYRIGDAVIHRLRRFCNLQLKNLLHVNAKSMFTGGPPPPGIFPPERHTVQPGPAG